MGALNLLGIPSGPYFSISKLSIFGGLGIGTTGTKIRTFPAATKEGPDSVTHIQDPIFGDRFVIKDDGIYAVIYRDSKAATSSNIGLTKNQTNLTLDTEQSTMPDKERLALTQSSAGGYESICIVEPFKAGDILRCVNDGGIDGVTTSIRTTLKIYKIS